MLLLNEHVIFTCEFLPGWLLVVPRAPERTGVGVASALDSGLWDRDRGASATVLGLGQGQGQAASEGLYYGGKPHVSLLVRAHLAS